MVDSTEIDDGSPAGVNNIYAEYLCYCNNPLTWVSDFFSCNFQNSQNCGNCGNDYKIKQSYIRWKCEECNTYFCCECFKFKPHTHCPLGHEFEYRTTNPYKGQYGWSCDICRKKYDSIEDFENYFDKICDSGYCKDCDSK